MSILITSILFFVTVAFSYRQAYQQTVLANNESYARRWSTSIDNRLNSLYEHMYDLLVNLFNNTNVNTGSLPMDYFDIITLQDLMNSKIMSSVDLTSVFIVDTESELYLFSGSRNLTQSDIYNQKIFLQQYSKENYTYLNNREWNVISILDKGYYYMSIRMGKYIVGAVSDLSLYELDDYDESSDAAGFISSESKLYLSAGNDELERIIKTNRTGDYIEKGYAVTTTELKYADAKTIFVTRPTGFSLPWRLASAFLILDSALCVLFVAMLMVDMDKNIRKPIHELIEANHALSDGNLDYRLDPNIAGSSEFEGLYNSFNEMSAKIGQLTIESYDQQLKQEQNRLKMLRAQVKPHTFLNAITTISNMTYTSKPEEIRNYINSFAKFTRYMLHTKNDWTTIEEELTNIESYVNMQKIRFPNSIEITYDCPEDIKTVKIPYLILFSLVENSFKHAMTLVETMYISIKAEWYEEEGFKGVRIIEEDNGSGFSQVAFDKLDDPTKDENFTKEHLGLTNVRYSLNLIYQRNDLLRLSNNADGGAHIEILIPEEKTEDETASM